MDRNLYPYAEGDRLEDRNTYFYSQFGGTAFLAAWKHDRDQALKELGAPLPAPATMESEDGAAAALFEALYAAAVGGKGTGKRFDLLLQRFETGKRLYARYDADLRALDRGDYRHLSLYLRFGEVLDAAYASTGRLDHLNALMKLLDILVSLRGELVDGERGRLARLISSERAFVDALAERTGVAP